VLNSGDPSKSNTPRRGSPNNVDDSASVRGFDGPWLISIVFLDWIRLGGGRSLTVETRGRRSGRGLERRRVDTDAGIQSRTFKRSAMEMESHPTAWMRGKLCLIVVPLLSLLLPCLPNRENAKPRGGWRRPDGSNTGRPGSCSYFWVARASRTLYRSARDDGRVRLS
jgi:hypothetical protein